MLHKALGLVRVHLDQNQALASTLNSFAHQGGEFGQTDLRHKL